MSIYQRRNYAWAEGVNHLNSYRQPPSSPIRRRGSISDALQMRRRRCNDDLSTNDASSGIVLSNNTFSFLEGKSLLACLFIHFGLQTNPLLLSRMPQVRRLALIETLRFNNAITETNPNIQIQDQYIRERRILKILLENFTTSSYISHEEFQNILLDILNSIHMDGFMESNDLISRNVLNGNWEDVLFYIVDLSLVLSQENTDDKDYVNDLTTVLNSLHDEETANGLQGNEEIQLDATVHNFRSMMVEIMSSSKKIAHINLNQRIELRRRIISSSTTSAILQSFLAYLFSSNLITSKEKREMEHLAVVKGRFDLLVLPKHLDCDDAPRSRNVSDGTCHMDADMDESTPLLCHISNINDYDEIANDEEEGLQPEVCVICLDIIDQSKKTVLEECNHSFCKACIEVWMSNNSTCPTCRHPIRNRSSRFHNYGSIARLDGDDDNGMDRLDNRESRMIFFLVLGSFTLLCTAYPVASYFSILVYSSTISHGSEYNELSFKSLLRFTFIFATISYCLNVVQILVAKE